jgi:hypothetical protein
MTDSVDDAYDYITGWLQENVLDMEDPEDVDREDAPEIKI